MGGTQAAGQLHPEAQPQAARRSTTVRPFPMMACTMQAELMLVLSVSVTIALLFLMVLMLLGAEEP